MKVYIVTNPELGWDCIVGVFATQALAAEAAYEGCVVFSRNVEDTYEEV